MSTRRHLEHQKGVSFARFALGLAAVIMSVVTSTAQAEPSTTNISTAVTIQAGADWIPLPYDPWIEPGSALDFSTVLPHHTPAGKFGRAVAVGDHFEFEGLPGVPQRFYGVNLCNTANLPSSPEAAERFVANLARIGYNALRIHHHERDLIAENGGWLPDQDDTVPSPAQMEKLDWLVAACVAHGVYLTTDLYVSRSYATRWRAIGIDRDGRMAGPSFKILCAFWEPAYSNLCTWTRNFLCHVNPFTGRSLAKEPALVALALINEGNLGNWGADALRQVPGVADAWQAWLAERRNDEAFADIPDSIPDVFYAADGSTPERRHAAAFAIFLAERETLLFERLKAFVREECGCRVPLSSLSAWYYPVQYQLPRTHFDYVDEHFYVDHPKWLERDWHLPSFCPNVNPVVGRDAGARDIEWRRLMDKPFCLTEWNFSGPGRFRGVGGIVTGALGAFQGWDGMWRFAWSHGRDGIEKPGARLDYFNVHGDPLGLAAERAALCLFLRRDLLALEDASPLVLDESALRDPRNGAPRLPGRGQSLALGWKARVGTRVALRANDGAANASNDGALRANDGGALRQMTNDVIPSLRGNAAPVIAAEGGSSLSQSGSVIASQTPVIIFPATGTFLLNTPRTAGGFAESGTHEAGALRFTLGGGTEPAAQDSSLAPKHSSLVTRHSSLRGGNPVAATVWASSLDGEPLSTSSRILVTHLTDVQNSGIRYGDAARTILLDWGGLPHLAENGSALIELQLDKRELQAAKGGNDGALRANDGAADAANDGGALRQMTNAIIPSLRGEAASVIAAEGGSSLPLKERPVIDGGDGSVATVYRLDTAGHHLAEIPASFDAATGRLRFTARTDYDPAAATLFYEIVRDPASPAP